MTVGSMERETRLELATLCLRSRCSITARESIASVSSEGSVYRSDYERIVCYRHACRHCWTAEDVLAEADDTTGGVALTYHRSNQRRMRESSPCCCGSLLVIM